MALLRLVPEPQVSQLTRHPAFNRCGLSLTAKDMRSARRESPLHRGPKWTQLFIEPQSYEPGAQIRPCRHWQSGMGPSAARPQQGTVFMAQHAPICAPCPLRCIQVVSGQWALAIDGSEKYRTSVSSRFRHGQFWRTHDGGKKGMIRDHRSLPSGLWLPWPRLPALFHVSC
jgi:hypothetical protein